MKKGQAGLSFVETIIAAGVLSLIVIFIVGMIPSFKMSTRRANMELQGGVLAQSALEELRSIPFDKAAAQTYDDVTIDGVTYQRQVQVSDVVSHGTPAVEIAHTVRVVVTWKAWDRNYMTFRETVFSRLLRS